MSDFQLTQARVLVLLNNSLLFKGFLSIDIIRHKDSMDELFSHRGEIFGTCGEEQKLYCR